MAEVIVDLPEGYGIPTVDLDTGLFPEPTMDAIGASDQVADAIGVVVSGATAGNLRALMSKLERGVQDAGILVVSDSTGNATDEWPYLVVQWLAAQFPAYTVVNRFWDEVGDIAYSAPTTVQTGTGAQTLSVWIAARAGSSPQHFLGSRFDAAIRNTTPDVIFTNHGHNLGDPTTTGSVTGGIRNIFFALTEEVAITHPAAGQVLMSQNPTTLSGRATWQAIKGQYAEQAAGLRSYGFLDIEKAFQDYGNWAADLTNVDGIHPNSAGSQLWASIVIRALDGSRVGTLTSITQSPLEITARNYLVNADFSDWTGTDPASWTPTLATTSKDTTNYESGAQGAKVTASASSGTAFIEQATGATLARELRGQTLTLAVRVRKPTANTQTVRIRLSDTTGSANARNVDVSQSAPDRFQWVFVNKVIDLAATNVIIQLQVRTSGTTVVDATFDRAFLVRGIMPHAS